MKRLLLFGVSFCLTLPSIAQNNFVATGADVSNASGAVSNSVGQVVYKSIGNGSGLIIEGVQQPHEITGPLPVTLLYFKATTTRENSVLLKWTTTSEFNSKDFQIERSFDAVHFQSITSVPAAGNSNTTNNYSAIDQNPQNGMNYYRLKQTDLDGKYEYSQVEKVEFDANSNTITAGPNPTNDHIILYMQFDNAQKAIYQISALSGRILAEEKITANSTRINLGNLPKGMYVLKVLQSGKPLKTFKIIKQ